MVELLPSKQITRVRFPSPASKNRVAHDEIEFHHEPLDFFFSLTADKHGRKYPYNKYLRDVRSTLPPLEPPSENYTGKHGDEALEK